MPVVTICPHYGNTNNLLYNILKGGKCAGDDFVKKVMEETVRESVRKLADDRFLPWYYDRRGLRVRPMFDVCEDKIWRESEECQLVYLLSAIAKVNSGGNFFDLRVVLEYVADKAAAGERPTLEGLQGHVEDMYKDIDLNDGKHRPYNKYFTDFVELYTYFFPVYKFYENETLADLRGLHQFEPPSAASVGADELADFLVHMIDRNVMRTGNSPKLNKYTAQLLFECLGSYLQLGNYNDTYLAMNTFHHLSEPFFGSIKDYQFDPCAGNGDLTEMCHQPATTDCQKYCELVAQGKERKNSIKSLYIMALENVGPIVNSNPVSLLPKCRYPEEEAEDNCWQQILTDKGVCFSLLTSKWDTHRKE